MTVPGETLVELFSNRIQRTPDAVSMKVKESGDWKSITFGDFDRSAREVAHGLLSLGVEKGDKVAILSANRPEWHICDVAVLLCGAVTVPVYVTNSPKQVAHVVGHSDSKVAIVEDDAQLGKVLETIADLPQLERVVVVQEGESGDERVLTLEELRDAGRRHSKDNPSLLEERIGSVKPGDLATIVYTSGTTGPPKGAMLTHGGFAWTLHCLGGVLGLGDCEDRLISYLPLSHVLERLASDWGGICFGF